MSDTSIDFHRAFFAKTVIGQQEIQNRALGLAPLVRRLLILIDGKRSGQELAAFVNGHAVADLLGELLTRKCVEVVASTAAATVTAPASPASETTASETLRNTGPANLPPPESRSAKEVEMARNFMINTVNMEFGQHMRLSLIEAISNCATADQLRQVYPLWFSTMASSRSAAKELPALRDKLLRVL
jgi:type IV secretory pathway VirJ component